VEAIIAEERSKQHHVLADQLSRAIQTPAASLAPAVSLNGNGRVEDFVSQVTPRRGIEDLLLSDETQKICSEFFEEHHRVDLLRTHNLEPRNRILLTGPPGNGKTSLAEVIAATLAVPLIVLRYDGVIGSFLGETASRLRRVFEFVRSRPCVFFLDEFDTIGKERGDVHETGEIKRVVSSLLLQVDAIPSYVILVTATNHPELLDRAVWRRFQIRIELPQPTRKQIEHWVAEAERRLCLSFEYSARRLADALFGASFAELEEFAQDVARRRVLAMPSPDTRSIVQQTLKHWRLQLSLKRT
jgi:SpoVK/Ycf46/Vps4 family AAA+-type ATPase